MKKIPHKILCAGIHKKKINYNAMIAFDKRILYCGRYNNNFQHFVLRSTNIFNCFFFDLTMKQTPFVNK